ncbi:MAG: hypothetical protein N2447_01820 [Thermoanaerobaculum sp.]|nr:hypothetical protein [Thermoanaerobaculum sp.]
MEERPLLGVAFLLLLALPPWFGLVGCLRRGKPAAGAAVVVLWSLALNLALALLESWFPGFCRVLIPGAAAYSQELMQWVRTGVGCEGEWSCFVPQHLWHLAVFAAATVATGGLGGLAVAGVLFGWMGAYTGELARWTGNSWAYLLGWHPWALLRVVAYVLIGVGLSEVMVHKSASRLWLRRRWWVAGLLFWFADLLMKGVLAQRWRTYLIAWLLP